MDRVINYLGQNVLETDLLQTSKNTMIAIGYALQAVLGTNTLADGLACTPTSPASMSVNVGPGSILSVGAIDATAYSSLAADARTIVKQGLSLDTITFPLTAPATVGQSVVYLIEAAYQDADANPVTLPYYNASNPSQAYSGPNNSGVAQYTTRQGRCLVQVKTGTAATTGSQATPTPDAGFTALYAVTVANGQTTITSGNIAVVGSPFVGAKLTARLSAAANLGDVANAATALTNLGGLRASNNLSDLPSVSTALTNLGMADSQGASGYKKLGKGLILQWTTSPSLSPGSGFSGSWPIAMTAHLWSTAALVSSGGSATSSSVNVSNTCTGTTYDVYHSGPTAAIGRVFAIGIL